jgi:GAF domain-containing protein
MNTEPDDRLASVFEALHELPHMRTPHEALDFVVKLLTTTVPSAALSGCLYDINTDELRFVAVTGPGADERRGTALRRSQGVFGRAARADNHALVVSDMADAPDYDAEVDGRPGLDLQNMLLRPVVHEGRLLGMLQLINRTTGTFSAPDLHLVNYTADRLGEFLHAARTRAQH